MAIVIGPCWTKFFFTKNEEEDIGNICCFVLRPVFEDCIISHRADVVWPSQSCNLTPLDYYLWGAVKDKCYADKLETIDALKEIFVKPLVKYRCTQSIMCLKIGPIVWVTAKQPFKWNYFLLLTGRIVLKRNLRKYSVVFFKAFSKGVWRSRFTYIHNWSLQHFSKDYDLASRTTYVVCVNFMHDWRDLQFKFVFQPKIFEKLLTSILFTLKVFARNLLRGCSRRKFFHISFCWRCLSWVWNRGFTSNKPTLYLLRQLLNFIKFNWIYSRNV